MIAIKAYAKINVGLKILNRRNDGYHTIETTLSTINLADIIELEESPSGINIETKDLDIPPRENLCYKAAALLKDQCNIERGVRIRIIKNIPVGGGLGGGSSDAAAVLKGMNKLFNLELNEEQLMNIGCKLGADVPFLIKGGAAYARGIGDELNFFSMPKMQLAIYYPGYPISTTWAYSEYDKLSLTPVLDTDSIMTSKEQKKKKIRIDFKLQNDFEKVVFAHHPDLLDVKANLLMAGAFFISISGSGSCVYTLIDSKNRKKIVEYFDGIGAQYYEVNTI